MKGTLFIIGLFLLLYGVPNMSAWAIITGLALWIAAGEIPEIIKTWVNNRRSGRLLWR
jgi:hypothetical protein